ncbi:bifunctional methylenetetrahydrofolate dehydrogenase/methenyltetrahydrofolate cyclohydrolase FolD [Sphingobium sp.]|uniref:bifunctional methylenetetrahydrofolate dehydrogenase/methenyltetrahydrofolate cyclohydrolase FolD n=1 Tax=Sphingobium sp. TaxID=1912891 RepID=UPI0028BDCD9B|nr:bifunctional methylenetetrahydrofolate dehydrogenase/methenyltetrahydrofolate cyclohydrolase FolD [Sphingobium sp.]
MNASIIDGKARAERLRADIATDTRNLAAAYGIVPTLATILIGNDPASAIYVRRKIEQTEEVGMRSLSFKLPSEVDEMELLDLIDRLNIDPSVHGILVQLPLPGHIGATRVLERISPLKDVDGFHVVNTGKLALGRAGLVPCTPMGCMMLLSDHVGNLEGLHAVVVGCSHIVGRPMAQLLLQARCTVSIAHIHTRNLPELVVQADILVVAAGAPGLIRGSWVKPGAVVIDVGINRVIDESSGKPRIVGDARFAEVAQVASAITPVPGGVGPMTIACLLKNTFDSAEASCLQAAASGRGR